MTLLYCPLLHFHSFLSVVQGGLAELPIFRAVLDFSLFRTSVSLSPQIKHHNPLLSPLQASDLGPSQVTCQPWARDSPACRVLL